MSQAVRYHLDAFPPRAKQLDPYALLEPLDEAATALGRYDAKMSILPNAELLLAPFRRQDAVTSSRMEGTFSTVENLYRLEAGDDNEDNNDDREVLLYSQTMQKAQDALEEGQAINEHFIKMMHQQLLSSGRGAHKNPGCYKTEQNFIGDERLKKVSYIPVDPLFFLKE